MLRRKAVYIGMLNVPIPSYVTVWPIELLQRVWRWQTSPSLIQKTDCRLVGAKTDLALEDTFQWNLNRTTTIFIYEIWFEHNVCKGAAILSHPHLYTFITHFDDDF